MRTLGSISRSEYSRIYSQEGEVWNVDSGENVVRCEVFFRSRSELLGARDVSTRLSTQTPSSYITTAFISPAAPLSLPLYVSPATA